MKRGKRQSGGKRERQIKRKEKEWHEVDNNASKYNGKTKKETWKGREKEVNKNKKTVCQNDNTNQNYKVQKIETNQRKNTRQKES